MVTIVPFEEIPFHLGLKATDVVFISADLKNVALQAKNQKQVVNIDLFINNLQEILNEGTLIFPAYTDYLTTGDTFDWVKSKPSTGALSNKVFKRKDFKRTKDPLHSVFVWGENTDELMNLNGISTFGNDSVFAFLHLQNAKFLFIDVHIENSFTFIHYIEEFKQVPYRKFYELNINISGLTETAYNKKVLFHTKKKGVVTDFANLQRHFDQTEVMTHLNFNSIPFDLIQAKEAVEITEKLINDKNYLYHFSFLLFIKQCIKAYFPFLVKFKKKKNQV